MRAGGAQAIAAQERREPLGLGREVAGGGRKGERERESEKGRERKGEKGAEDGVEGAAISKKTKL